MKQCAKRLALEAATLAVGGLGGWFFSLLAVPLPWLLGPLVTVGGLSLAGFSLSTPWGCRQAGQVLVGTGIGLKFTLAVALFVADHLMIMVLCALTSVALGAAASILLRRATDADIATAYFACVPGGVAEMSVQAERHGGESGPVALAQALRVLCVVTTVPIGLTWAGVTSDPLFDIPEFAFDATGFGPLLIIALSSGALLAWRRVANAWMLGPMAAAATLTASDITLSGMPIVLLNVAQVMLGCTLGLRYRRAAIERLKSFLMPLAVSTIALVGLNILLGVVVGLFTSLPISSMILSLAPGGMPEMAITAKVLDLAVPLVVAFHIVRIFIVVAISGLVFRHAVQHETKRDPPVD
ncbi:MAG: hypothetical protein CMM47_08300 [Rhodospirillaceae bacterium]|nr:hypothetical protein [Rhodospirillaceae bacterium]